MSTRALATIGSGPMRDVLDLSLRTFRPYAARHGYDLVVGTGESGGRPPAWSKILLMRRLLDAYDEVLWIDADAIILDGSRDLSDDMLPRAYHGLVRHARGDDAAYPNTGVWLVRGARGKALLDAVWRTDRYVDHEWWENAALMDLLGYDLPSGRIVRTSPWMAGTCWLDQTWNGHTGFVGLAPVRIRHYAGVRHASRLDNLRLDLRDLDDAENARRDPRFTAGRPSREPWVQEWITREERERSALSPL